ncbi:MAG TPA: sirohydrochlorin chelatase [Stellaceae bacterium]|jgi:sirohydrochlorin cobaltochelatase|nr:sirohydrochlorin chelatase [Stellaceae bacterium]
MAADITADTSRAVAMGRTGIMVCGHGSRDEAAMAEFQLVAAGIRARLPDFPIETGYLEFARPTIREGLEALRAQGVDHILAVPGMLMAASHVKNDLPWELNTFAAAHDGLDIRFGRDLGLDPRLLAAASERIAEAAGEGPRDETLLVVVGRGTNDSDANSNISKVARMLWEGMGFGWAEVAYSGVAHPRVDACLERAMKMGYRRIVVFPYFLFTGVLVKRIYDQTDAVAAAHPGVAFIKAPYLRDHPLVMDAFADRAAEMLGETPPPNCRLCKYRTQIVGYEDDLGAAQRGHHHHVAGIGTGTHDHGHHDADHHHAGHHHHHHGHDQ